MKQRFDLRKSPVDGMIRRWETMTASSLGMVDLEDTQEHPPLDYDVQVCTGVFKTRREVFVDIGAIKS